MRRCIQLLLAALTVSGCLDRPGEPPAGDIRASLIEELRIDGHAHTLVPLGFLPEGPAIYPDGAVAVAQDGSIVILQRQTRQVLFFSDSGDPLGAFGREGAGPGEFRSITRIGWLADSLWLHDSSLERLTLVSPSRTLLRTSTIAGTRPSDVGGGLEAAPFIFLGPLSDGSIIKSILTVREQPIARALPEGTITRVLALVPGRDGARDASGYPVGPVHGVSPDGELVGFATVSVDEQGAPAYGVSIFNVAGDTVFIREYQPEELPAGGDSPLRGLTIGRDESVWLQIRDRESSSRYLVLDRRGNPIGTVDVPGRARIAVAELERIWVTEQDALGVESVVRYRVAW